MAKSEDNELVAGLRGAVGRRMVFRNVAGKTVVSRKRKIDPNYVPTEQQVNVRERFSDAILYAKAACVDPATKAAYALAAKPGQSAFNVAMLDSYKAPQISQLRLTDYTGQVGDIILVKAVDNFKVTEVQFSILKPDGSLLERGMAVKEPNGRDWKYVCTVQNGNLPGTRVIITAKDLPGNLSELQEIL